MDGFMITVLMKLNNHHCFLYPLSLPTLSLSLPLLSRSLYRVAVVDANDPAEVLDRFDICSSHLLCIASGKFAILLAAGQTV